MDDPEVIPRPDAEPHVHSIFVHSTQTWQWIVADPDTKHAVIIDPVLDQLPRDQGICTTAADQLLQLVRQNKYYVARILETRTQRTCQTAAWYLRTQLRDAEGHMPRICTGKSIAGVQRMFARQYRVQDAGWGRHFDSSFRDGQILQVGHLTCQVIQLDVNSHAFVVGHNVFLGEQPEEPLMRRMGAFTAGYRWHPENLKATPPLQAMVTKIVTPVSPQDQSLHNVDAQLVSPLTPNTNTKRYGRKPPSAIYEMAG